MITSKISIGVFIRHTSCTPLGVQSVFLQTAHVDIYLWEHFVIKYHYSNISPLFSEQLLIDFQDVVLTTQDTDA